MKRETMMINVWIVSYFNAIEGLHYNNLHTDCDSAIANFNEIVSESIRFASEEMTDFRVSRNVNSLTICDVADDRAVIACEVIKQAIQCGIMSM